MKQKIIAAAIVTAASLVLAACGDDDSDSGGGTPTAPAERTGTLTVWLMQDAEGESWAPIVEQATAKFHETYPNVDVDVVIQQWDGINDRLNTAFASNSPPDVVELGNTLAPTFAASGALADLTDHRGEFENSDSWLTILENSSTYDGRLYAVPYYAGSRVLTYRKDMFEEAGIDGVPTSMAELMSALDALNETFGDDPNFSAFHIPGQHWYLIGALIADQQGDSPSPFADFSNGTWTANLTSPESIAGLELFEELRSKYSKADPQGNEASQAYDMGNNGNIAMFYGANWEMWETANEANGGNPDFDTDLLGQFPMPSVTPGQSAPAFMGGSDLAVSQKSDQQDLARAWIAAYTSNELMTALVEATGVVPNTTTLLSLQPDNPSFQAAERTWFVPTSKNWATVEGQRIPQDLGVSIATGTPVAEAAATANDRIQEILDRP